MKTTAAFIHIICAIYPLSCSGSDRIDSLVNTTENTPKYSISAQTEAVHSRLVIADLHSDSLMWNKYLNS